MVNPGWFQLVLRGSGVDFSRYISLQSFNNELKLCLLMTQKRVSLCAVICTGLAAPSGAVRGFFATGQFTVKKC